MSIASRITSIEGHISDIYDSVELTGVDTTDIDKNLVNVPNTLKEGYIDIINNGTDTLYNNFPKVSGEGTSLTLNNTYQAPMRNNLKGNTSQTGTPTPTNPIPVNVVSGDNAITISNQGGTDSNTYNIDLPVENLFKEWLSGTVNTTTGEITSVARNRSDYIYVEPSTVYNLWREDTGFATYLIEYNENKAFIQEQHLSSNVTSGTFTTSATTKFVILFQYTNYSPTNKAQLTKGSKLYPYTPYGSAIELCKIGNYQDYFYKDSDKWYLHKEIGKVVLNGSENWQTISSGNLYYITGTGIKQQTGITQEIPMLSNRFIGYSYQTLYDALVDYGISSHTTDRLCIRNKDITSVANLKTWLGNNNTIVYFPLATPTNTEITDTTLINQLEELYIAKSKENQTNISQINNDLGFIINASALKKG